MIQAALYVRVSTEDQAVEGHSLESQLRLLREYCVRKGYAVSGEYVDPGESATTTDRPAFQRIFSDARLSPRAFDVVIVHKIDRWCRSLVDTMITLRDLSALGVGFASVTEDLDFTTPAGMIVLAVQGTMAELYSRNLSAETARGKAERARKGLYNGVVPFGYERTPRVEGQPPQPPRVRSQNASGLRMAFELCAQGMTPLQIAQALNAAGYRTSGNRGANPFGVDTVLPMLKNRFGLGEVSYKGEWRAGAHPALIDRNLWET